MSLSRIMTKLAANPWALSVSSFCVTAFLILADGKTNF